MASKDKAFCTICASQVSSLRISPKGHERAHGEDERACDECWEAWLSMQVEENRPEDIQCIFCNSIIDFEQLASYAWKGTHNRYSAKTITGIKCMNRCTKISQDFEREKGGRVFTCANCAFQVCVDCDHSEHAVETCREYQTRMASVHGAAEQKTRDAYQSCPSCDVTVETRRCGSVQCNCGYRFCSRCMIPWVGVGSAYLWKKQAHRQRCKYHWRDDPRAHTLKHRFLDEEEGHARKVSRRKANREAMETEKPRSKSTYVEPEPKKKTNKRPRTDLEGEGSDDTKGSKNAKTESNEKKPKVPRGPKKGKAELNETKPKTTKESKKGRTKSNEKKPRIKKEVNQAIKSEVDGEKTSVKVETKPEVKTETWE